MSRDFILSTLDYFLKPTTWYEYHDLQVEGFRLIANKFDQLNAGINETAAGLEPRLKMRQFGLNPIKPYRDYYGSFLLATRLLPAELEVRFAIGYTINSKVNTIDDFSRFGWLRLATHNEDFLYPNLSQQKQLLDYLKRTSSYPGFIVTRVYHYLQFDLGESLIREIINRESGN